MHRVRLGGEGPIARGAYPDTRRRVNRIVQDDLRQIGNARHSAPSSPAPAPPKMGIRDKALYFLDLAKNHGMRTIYLMGSNPKYRHRGTSIRSLSGDLAGRHGDAYIDTAKTVEENRIPVYTIEPPGKSRHATKIYRLVENARGVIFQELQ